MLQASGMMQSHSPPDKPDMDCTAAVLGRFRVCPSMLAVPAVMPKVLPPVMLNGDAAVMGLSKLESMAALLPLRSRPAKPAEGTLVAIPMKEGKTALLPTLLPAALEPLLILGDSSLHPLPNHVQLSSASHD